MLLVDKRSIGSGIFESIDIFGDWSQLAGEQRKHLRQYRQLSADLKSPVTTNKDHSLDN